MGRDSKHAKKRKTLDEDTSEEGRRAAEEREERRERAGDSPPPSATKSKRAKQREKTPENDEQGQDSLSIEETNKLRAKLGMAPLDTEEKPKVRDAEDGDLTDKIVTEDGMEFRHRAAENLAEKQHEAKIKEKLETAKQKRKIQEKVLKAKRIADEVEDDDAAAWVAKMRQSEREKKLAEERAKMLDEMDEEFGVQSVIDEEKERQRKKKAREAAKRRQATQEAATAGFIVGHSKDAFLGDKDAILVLEDKGVLEDGDEILVNLNLKMDENSKRNVELKKRKDHYRPYDEAFDSQGNPVSTSQMLAKYDEELEGVRRETFRLDDRGEVDLTAEEEETRMRRQLEMAGKQIISLEQEKYKIASDFYTQEEMISFRKPKKTKGERKTRKKIEKVLLKADDLVPIEEDEDRKKDVGSRRRRHGSEGEEEKMEEGDKEEGKEAKEEGKEDGELNDNDEEGTTKKGWKRATRGAVNIALLKRLAEQAEEDDSDEEEMCGPADLAGIAIDDDATDELALELERARRLRFKQYKPETNPEDVAKKVYELASEYGGGEVKKEVDEEGEEIAMMEEDEDDRKVCIDATMEYCRNIGEMPTYGLAGNRLDSIDLSSLEQKQEIKKTTKEDALDEFESVQKWKRLQAEKERRRRGREAGPSTSGTAPARGTWADATKVDSDDEREMEEAERALKEEEDSDEDSDEDFQNVLGDEADVTKGVGAMLKLASQKGYLADPNAKRVHGQSLKHLENRNKTQIASDKMDIEEKYTKKLERMGTTGTGPTRNFNEKKEYCPEIILDYVDEKGRPMEPKEAFRVLSWKFHGKKPGKKQVEKRIRRIEKKELMKKMDSWDTPLGTLNKQLKKQEQLQTPFIVLSKSGQNDSTALKKE